LIIGCITGHTKRKSLQDDIENLQSRKPKSELGDDDKSMKNAFSNPGSSSISDFDPNAYKKEIPESASFNHARNGAIIIKTAEFTRFGKCYSLLFFVFCFGDGQ